MDSEVLVLGRASLWRFQIHTIDVTRFLVISMGFLWFLPSTSYCSTSGCSIARMNGFCDVLSPEEATQ